jgi:1,4-dihydroxy-2-naphthoate octaprenyltransferase
MHNDRLHGKHTFASLLGPTGARVYHTVLLTCCLALCTAFGHRWTLCILPVWAWHLYYMWTHTERLDKQMPVLMFSTLIVSILTLF